LNGALEDHLFITLCLWEVLMLGLLQFLYVLLINAVIGRFVYTQIVQNHLAPSGYMKIPTELSRYYKGTSFLPRLNNEIAKSRNEIYKKRLSSLNHLTLIMVGGESGHHLVFIANYSTRL
jgi:hypothetical protein